MRPYTEQQRKQLERLGQELEEAEREQQAYFEHLHPPCPVDGKPGTFLGIVGSFQLVVPAFVCPDGHKFSYRDELDELEPDLPVRERGRLLRDQSGESITPKGHLWPDAE